VAAIACCRGGLHPTRRAATCAADGRGRRAQEQREGGVRNDEAGNHHRRGAGGLTAGLELLRRTDIVPVILEASQEIGGISRTIRYKGNRMDIGGHRFFSKSDR